MCYSRRIQPADVLHVGQGPPKELSNEVRFLQFPSPFFGRTEEKYSVVVTD